MGTQPKRQPSAPFAHRELNGQTLLEELEALREAQVGQRHLDDCALILRRLPETRVAAAADRVRHLAAGRFAAQPALASLLVRWAARLRSEVDIRCLASHFGRLALTAALIGALRRGAGRLGGKR